jgi:hypothetical protein
VSGARRQRSGELARIGDGAAPKGPHRPPSATAPVM